MDPLTLRLGSEPLPYFRTHEFSEVMLEVDTTIKRLVGTEVSSRAAVLAASGTGAMEAAVISTFTPSDKVLVVEGGAFGRRFGDICHAHGIPHEALQLQFGEALTADHLQRYTHTGLTGMLVNSHETSVGQLYNLRMLRDFCKANEVCLVVDAIGSFLADDYRMDELGVDVTIISSQKGLGLPPGLAVVIANRQTYEQRISRGRPRSVYLDLRAYFTDMERGQTPFTPAEGIVLQLHEKLRRLESETVESRINRSANLASDFRGRVRSLAVTVPSYPLSNALTPLLCDSAYDVFTRLKDEYGLWVTPSGGELKDVLIRVGHLGELTIEDNERLANALGEVV